MLSLIRKYPVQVVSVALMGVIIYLLLSPSAAEKTHATEVKSMTAARNLCLACRQYSRAHDGAFPPSLDALFPTYLQSRLVLMSPLNPAEPLGYTYTPPGPGLTDSPDTIVLEDKFAPALLHSRIVSYANGSARILPAP